ncbi:hypothetical protein D3C78_1753400 [compost metagenome]
MLSCASLHPGAAGRKTIKLGTPPMLVMLLLVFLGEAKCCFLGNCPDRPCAEHVFLAKHNLCKIVGFRLIFTGKVKIDIGDLVPFKAKERFKRNILALAL